MVPMRFVPASSFGLEALAELYTRTFDDYFYHALVTPEQMAQFVRCEQVDLERSPVLLLGDEQVGLATVGLRGAEAYCKGFGITLPFRGRGLAHVLCAEVLKQARQAGARRLGLGVLQKNERAVRAYVRAGLRVWRELLSFEWKRTPSLSVPVAVGALNPGVRGIEPATALAYFTALHRVPPIWERDVPTLSVLEGLKGVGLWQGEALRAYLLYRPAAHGTVEIEDVGSDATQNIVPLLRTLQDRYAHITCGNEPAESPAVAAFRAAGFTETWPRYEMTIEL